MSKHERRLNRRVRWFSGAAVIVAALVALLSTLLDGCNDGSEPTQVQDSTPAIVNTVEVDVKTHIDIGAEPNNNNSSDEETLDETCYEFTDDEPDWSPDKTLSKNNEGWRGGDPDGQGGFGPPQYYGNSNYAYASTEGDWDQSNSIAVWNLGQHSGRRTVQVYIPVNHSTATVTYHIYKDEQLLDSVPLSQSAGKGWQNLTELNLGNRTAKITVQLKFVDSIPSVDRAGEMSRSVAIDAIRIKCLK